MCKKLIYLLSLVFVLSMVLADSANAVDLDADPNLQLWFEFEDDINDSSGNDRHGTAGDEEDYTDGRFGIGRAIDLDGDDSVWVTDWKGITGTSAFTIAAWINSSDGAGTIVGWGTGRGNDDEDIQFRTYSSGVLRIDNGKDYILMKTKINDNEWRHIAVTVANEAEMSFTDVVLYLNGFDDTDTSDNSDPGTSIFNVPPTSGYDVRIGNEYDREDGRKWAGDIDDLRIYNRELSADEIRIVAGLAGPILTEPADDAVLTATSRWLKWTPGLYPATHEVYLSDIFEDVNTGDGGALEATLSGSSFEYQASGLDTATVYYWKVDAVNDSPPPGRWSSELWSFTVPAYEAWDPYPEPGRTYIDPDVTLSWKMGMGGSASAVYFGTNFADVNSATGATWQSGTTYTPPGSLAYDANYYWRVDTNDGDFVKGLVWSFTTQPFIPIGDPNLALWWKMDDVGSGTAIDSSGHGRHGSLRSDAHFVSGHLGDAVAFDGSEDRVIADVPDGYTAILGANPFTVAAWINTTVTDNTQVIANWGSSGGTARRVEFRINSSQRLRLDNGSGNVQGDSDVVDGEWHHVAVTVRDNATCSHYAPDNLDVYIYVDGQNDTRTASDDDVFAIETEPDVYFTVGRRETQTEYRPFEGLIDDVRLYDRVLSGREVEHLMDPAMAYGPSPADNERDVPILNPKLIWSPGTDENTGKDYPKHDLYYGESFDDVNSGDAGVFIDRLDANEYEPPANLEYYKYYYWRVDEVNTGGEAFRGRVWNFKAIYDEAQVLDPNLLAWYEFDGDATDSSGYGRDAAENGDIYYPNRYADDYNDQVIQLDGTNDYAVYSFIGKSRPAYTVTAWAKAETLGQTTDSGVFASLFPTDVAGFQLGVDGNDPGLYRYHDSDVDKPMGPVSTGWVHLAAAFNGASVRLYYDGTHVGTAILSDPNESGIFNAYAMGTDRGGSEEFEGAIDDVRIYGDRMEEDDINHEIQKVMRGDMALAWRPYPAHGQTGVPTTPTLSWERGDYAPPTNRHYVYFGADDPGNMVEVPLQPQTPNDLDVTTIPAYAEGLDLGTTYYWAVHEVNVAGGVNPGKTWSFTVTEFLVVDDMESYTRLPDQANNIFGVWIDDFGRNAPYGDGSVVSVEDTIAADGNSMRFDFNDTVAGLGYLSMAKAEVANLPIYGQIGNDWTSGGAEALSLQFYGDPNNGLETMWVKLGDTDGNSTTVTYGDYLDEDTNDVNEASWQEWNIALSDFTGVDVTSVNDITIGFGDGTLGGGAPAPNFPDPNYDPYTAFFDDIRLYAARCVLGKRDPNFARFDYAPTGPGGDCVIDAEELDVMFGDWLESDSTAYATVPPDDANLVGHWEFEGDFNDSSGNGHDGDPCGDATIVPDATRGSNVLILDANDDYVNITGYKGILGPNAFSVAAWINTTSTHSSAGVDQDAIIGWGADGGGEQFNFRISNEGPQEVPFSVRYAQGNGNVQGYTPVNDGEWHHVAATVASGGVCASSDIRIYVDGKDDTRESTDSSIRNIVAGADVGIGLRASGGDRFFEGLIDDVRIYDRALTQAEILGAAGIAEAYNKVKSVANVYDEEPENERIVNFLDYAVLVERWLEKDLFPPEGSDD